MRFRKVRSMGLASALLGSLMALALPGTAKAGTQDYAAVFTYNGHAVNVRDEATTSSAKIGSIPAADSWPCFTSSGCYTKAGGSYTCWSGGPSGNRWVKVAWGDFYGWVPQSCVRIGRA